MKKYRSALLLLIGVCFSFLSAGCKKNPPNPTAQPEPEDSDAAPPLIDEPTFILSGDEFYFVVKVERVGTYASGPRTAEIWIQSEVPVSKVYMDDLSFEGVGYGTYSAKGVAGSTSDSFLREVKYSIAGTFSGLPKCEINLDVLEEIGEGEVCVTLPIVGTTCDEIPESETERFHFEPIVIPFDTGGLNWIYTHDWNTVDMYWTDHIDIVQANLAFDKKLFENLGCVPKELME